MGLYFSAWCCRPVHPVPEVKNYILCLGWWHSFQRNGKNHTKATKRGTRIIWDFHILNSFCCSIVLKGGSTIFVTYCIIFHPSQCLSGVDLGFWGGWMATPPLPRVSCFEWWLQSPRSQCIPVFGYEMLEVIHLNGRNLTKGMSPLLGSDNLSLFELSAKLACCTDCAKKAVSHTPLFHCINLVG